MFHRISLIFEVFEVDLDGLNDDDFSCQFFSFDSAKHEFLKVTVLNIYFSFKRL